jgi:hypothetical protein
MFRVIVISLVSIVGFCRDIDVVIPCIAKDREMLQHCIQAVKKHGVDVRRVIVISPEKLTDDAEWIPETIFPFTKAVIAKEIDPSIPEDHHRLGWILQQLIKLYAPLVIPDISSSVLVLDADTVFLKRVRFFQDDIALYSYSFGNHKPYFAQLKRLLPEIKRSFGLASGVCHHMIFQESVLREIFAKISERHNTDPWKAICNCIDVGEIGASGFSEYELYFNYVFGKKRVKLRKIRAKDLQADAELNWQKYRKEGLSAVSFHRAGS